MLIHPFISFRNGEIKVSWFIKKISPVVLGAAQECIAAFQPIHYLLAGIAGRIKNGVFTVH